MANRDTRSQAPPGKGERERAVTGNEPENSKEDDQHEKMIDTNQHKKKIKDHPLSNRDVNRNMCPGVAPGLLQPKSE